MGIGGGGTFTSDQTTLQKDTGAISVLRAARTRVTSIQGRGEAGSVLLLHDSATTSGAGAGNLKATYKYDTEGLSVYIPGSGILFKDGVCATLTQTGGTDGSVTLTITGA
tara:strand:+ start:242 stop:571 length:330 start_codon:yes stop_codon:yes gene_type:complete